MRATVLLLSLIVVFMIPWEDIVNVPLLGTAARTMGLGVAAIWIATVIFTGKIRPPASFHVAAAIYLAWNALSVFWSGDPERTLVQVLTAAQLLAFSLILWDVCSSKAALWGALQMYVLGAYVALASTVINYVSGTTYYYERFSATGTNPDDLGVILALGIPAAAYLATSLRGIRSAPWLKAVNVAYIPAACLGIIMSGTRTALIAALPGMLFGASAMTRLKPWAQVAVVAVLATGAMSALPYVPQASLQRLGTTSSELSTGDFNGRRGLWKQGFVSFLEHPLFGIGGNMYRSVNVERKVAHNAFVSVTVELGLIGLAIFCGVVTLAAAAALAQPQWELRLWLAVLATWSVGALALTWENRKPTWLFFSLMVVGAGLPRPGGPPVSRSSPPRPSPPDPSPPAPADPADELHPDNAEIAQRGSAPTM